MKWNPSSDGCDKILRICRKLVGGHARQSAMASRSVRMNDRISLWLAIHLPSGKQPTLSKVVNSCRKFRNWEKIPTPTCRSSEFFRATHLAAGWLLALSSTTCGELAEPNISNWTPHRWPYSVYKMKGRMSTWALERRIAMRCSQRELKQESRSRCKKCYQLAQSESPLCWRAAELLEACSREWCRSCRIFDSKNQMLQAYKEIGDKIK